MEKGLIHVYFGNGKGKTTAAIGLSYRAVCRGLSVGFASFLKCADCPEISPSAPWQVFTPKRDYGFWKDLSDAERRALTEESKERLEDVFAHAKDFDLIVLDEILTAAQLGVVDEARLLSLLKSRPKGLEVVLTGHTLSDNLRTVADYITQMTALRHPYEQGIAAREGIEY